jgi:ectoine hydroxylase-related dioxygenase (phytanoyl-CoA dioxygenase family)
LCLEELLAHCGTDLENHLLQVHLVQSWADELVRHPAVLDAVEDMLGPNLFAWKNKCFLKPPRPNLYVSWHQDDYNENFDSLDTLTTWVALSDSTAKHGCVRVIDGSHRRGKIPHIEKPTKDNLSTRGPQLTEPFDESLAVDLELRPGEMSIHHPRVIHGSGANVSGQPRIGFATVYVATSTKQTTAPSHGATLVRGVDTEGYFPVNARPSGSIEAQARAACETFLQFKNHALPY